MRATLATLAALVLAGAVLVSPSTAESPARASARAAVVTGDLGDVGALRVSGDGRRGRTLEVGARGVSAASAEVVVRASRDGGTGSAEATSAARSVSLLGGLVSAYGVRRRAEAQRGEVAYSGGVRGLRIDGRLVGDQTAERSFELGEVGTVVVNRRGAGLRVVLTRAAGGFPAGTRITVADVEAAATNGADPAAKPAPTPTPEPEAPERGQDEGAGERDKAAPARRAKRKRPPKPALAKDRYAFPVYGDVTFDPTFGAPRQIGAHQGNDIFAAFGSPVLAVADGVLSKVGTLPISGNRLWLRTRTGDEFFYAHLSSFAPAAVNGGRVKAGSVLGFIGNTGDAEPTPPHLHFEIHPDGGDAIDPYRILGGWQRNPGVSPGAGLARYTADGGRRPGALVEVRDFIADG